MDTYYYSVETRKVQYMYDAVESFAVPGIGRKFAPSLAAGPRKLKNLEKPRLSGI